MKFEWGRQEINFNSTKTFVTIELIIIKKKSTKTIIINNRNPDLIKDNMKGILSSHLTFIQLK